MKEVKTAGVITAIGKDLLENTKNLVAVPEALKSIKATNAARGLKGMNALRGYTGIATEIGKGLVLPGAGIATLMGTKDMMNKTSVCKTHPNVIKKLKKKIMEKKAGEAGAFLGGIILPGGIGSAIGSGKKHRAHSAAGSFTGTLAGAALGSIPALITKEPALIPLQRTGAVIGSGFGGLIGYKYKDKELKKKIMKKKASIMDYVKATKELPTMAKASLITSMEHTKSLGDLNLLKNVLKNVKTMDSKPASILLGDISKKQNDVDDLKMLKDNFTKKFRKGLVLPAVGTGIAGAGIVSKKMKKEAGMGNLIIGGEKYLKSLINATKELPNNSKILTDIAKGLGSSKIDPFLPASHYVNNMKKGLILPAIGVGAAAVTGGLIKKKMNKEAADKHGLTKIDKNFIKERALMDSSNDYLKNRIHTVRKGMLLGLGAGLLAAPVYSKFMAKNLDSVMEVPFLTAGTGILGMDLGAIGGILTSHYKDKKILQSKGIKGNKISLEAKQKYFDPYIKKEAGIVSYIKDLYTSTKNLPKDVKAFNAITGEIKKITPNWERFSMDTDLGDSFIRNLEKDKINDEINALKDIRKFHTNKIKKGLILPVTGMASAAIVSNKINTTRKKKSNNNIIKNKDGFTYDY